MTIGGWDGEKTVASCYKYSNEVGWYNAYALPQPLCYASVALGLQGDLIVTGGNHARKIFVNRLTLFQVEIRFISVQM